MLLKLFLTFFRLGAVTFGGGYAMMALLEQELVENNEWMTGEELLEITAIAQITPGTIAINAATFVGRRMAGIPGAVTASAAVVLPPLLIVGFLASYLPVWLNLPWLQGAFLGMRYAVAALIFHAAVKMLCSNVTTALGRALFSAAFLALLLTPVHPLMIILVGGAVGMSLYAGNALPDQNTVAKGSQ
ncbi:chromate transporter [Endozoicomonas lisbonensis]